MIKIFICSLLSSSSEQLKVELLYPIFEPISGLISTFICLSLYLITKYIIELDPSLKQQNIQSKIKIKKGRKKRGNRNRLWDRWWKDRNLIEFFLNKSLLEDLNERSRVMGESNLIWTRMYVPFFWHGDDEVQQTPKEPTEWVAWTHKELHLSFVPRSFPFKLNLSNVLFTLLEEPTNYSIPSQSSIALLLLESHPISLIKSTDHWRSWFLATKTLVFQQHSARLPRIIWLYFLISFHHWQLLSVFKESFLTLKNSIMGRALYMFPIFKRLENPEGSVPDLHRSTLSGTESVSDRKQISIPSIAERDLDVAAKLVAQHHITTITPEESIRIRRKIDLNCKLRWVCWKIMILELYCDTNTDFVW